MYVIYIYLQKSSSEIHVMIFSTGNKATLVCCKQFTKLFSICCVNGDDHNGSTGFKRTSSFISFCLAVENDSNLSKMYFSPFNKRLSLQAFNETQSNITTLFLRSFNRSDTFCNSSSIFDLCCVSVSSNALLLESSSFNLMFDSTRLHNCDSKSPSFFLRLRSSFGTSVSFDCFSFISNLWIFFQWCFCVEYLLSLSWAN